MMSLPIKRGREGEFDSITTMANCLMLLSQGRNFDSITTTTTTTNGTSPNHRVFECKTCNRQFPSFQALGGHRASHKKPKLGGDLTLQTQSPASPAKPKTHECSICGLEFAIGQALGGHMRRHRSSGSGSSTSTTTTTTASANDNNLNHHGSSPVSSASASPPLDSAVKKSNVVVDHKHDDIRKIWGLDLNLTPFENKHLEFQVGKMAPPVDCFI